MAMKDTIRIFHIGDIHLDSPYSGQDVRVAERRRAEHLEAFLCALKAAKDHDLVLISGDLFDSGYVTDATVRAVYAALGELNIPVVISPGNHDPYTAGGFWSRRRLPENVHVFTSEEMGRFDLDELCVSVHGYAFLSNRYSHDPLSHGYELREGYINLLCAHTELDEAIPRFAPIKREELARGDFAYAALGHVHLHSDPVRAGKTTYSYCGFMFGRSFDELGFGRGLSVTVDREGNVSVEAVRLADKQYAVEELNIGGCETTAELSGAVAQLIKSRGYGEETCLRVVLTGAVSPELKIPDSLPSPTAILQIKNKTTPAFDAALLEADITLKGALYRRLAPKLVSDDEYERRVAHEALKMGLCALEGKSFLN